jgi:ligand-binding sensor domain-containing protein/signal transduction histidine kinase
MTTMCARRTQEGAFANRIPIRAIVALLLVVVCAPALALDPALQPSQYALDTWQGAQGLPQNSAVTVARTPDGYLWIGTEEGLARFDGVRFIVFDHSNTPAIPSKNIQVLFVDRAGRLWIGTEDGVAMFENGQFKSIKTLTGLAHAGIRAIIEDKAQRFWVGTTDGLVQIDGDSSRVFGISDGLHDSTIRAILEDRTGLLWVATATGALHRFDGNAFKTVNLGPETAPDPVSAMHEDAKGILWFGTKFGGLYRKTGERYDVVAPRGRLGSAVRALTSDRDGNLWIGTSGGGVVRLRDGAFSVLDSTYFPSADQIALYEDNEGSLWVGSNGGGLSRLWNGKFVSFGVPEGLQGNVVWSIAPRAGGGIWVGTDAGLSAYVGSKFSHMAGPQGFANARVQSLLVDRSGALWVGSDGAGVYRRDRDHVTVFNQLNGLSDNSVNAIIEDRNGRVWIGTNLGLDLIDGETVTSMQSLLHSSGPTQVNVIHEDRTGALWVATASDGLFVIDGPNTRHFGLVDGLPSNRVYAIYEDERGVLWLGTMEGLAVWRGGKISSLAGSAPQLRESIMQLLEDDQHRIWISTNKGLTSVPRESLDTLAAGGSVTPAIQTYDTADGMRAAEFVGGYSSAGCRTMDGRLWFPSIRGIVSVDPARIRMNTLPPPVQIEQVMVDAEPMALLQGLKVEPGREQWEFTYTALSLLASQRSHFRYRLEGFDRDWIDAGSRRTAYYTRLPPGTYTFRVIASNNDGVWNHTGASFRFTLEPHFYQTVWFMVICAIAVLLLARVWYRWRMRQLRRLADVLSEQVADRTRDLVVANKQMREAQDTLVTTARQAGMAEIANNVLHNVGNVLNSVNVSAALIGSKLRDSKSAGLAKAVNLMNEHAADLGSFITLDERGKALPGYLNKLVATLAQEKQGVAEELDSLTKSVDHIKEIVATQQSYSGVSSVIEPVQVKDLLEDALRMNAGSIAHHQISIIKEFAEVPLMLLDKHLMLQILINLIGNAKHAINGNSQQPPQIKLKMDIAEGSDAPRLRIRIEDNGEGIAPENLTRLFAHGFTTRKNGHGFGLHSCALAVKEMKGNITAFSDGLGRGAAFVLELPINRAAESP